eukprot:TRINITY_DN21934_c0_g1_i3.p1 TRINITY_DN21934_c0_g1~~TRINITY_DN21934_c0_g1_i3.p1  ORF type:complete len:612 (-),score=88.09 TRINITY_DN21934_c0_g1_i3:58-1893(-)
MVRDDKTNRWRASEVFPHQTAAEKPSGVDGDWTCTACGNVNFRFRPACNRCGRPKNSQSVSSAAVSSAPSASKGSVVDAPAVNDWKCFSCASVNFARRSECFRCQAPRPHEGTFDQDKGGHGFIRPREGGDLVFVLPSQCKDFGGSLPAVGTPVRYMVERDEQGRRDRAFDVRLDRPGFGEGQLLTGTIEKENGVYGFIKQDGYDEMMFVLPFSCRDGVLPPVGTRVVYSVVKDGKTGRPRAEDVELEEEDTRARPTRPKLQAGDACTGTVIKHNEEGNYGFIRQDDCDEHAFFVPSECTGFQEQLPPIGTRVSYTLGVRGKTGRFMALNIHSESHSQASEEFSGTFSKDNGNFGFIDQDTGGEAMFVLPMSFEDIGGSFPTVGTRVVYSVVTDKKTGRPRAENVRCEAKTMPAQLSESSKPKPKSKARRRPSSPTRPPRSRFEVHGDGNANNQKHVSEEEGENEEETDGTPQVLQGLSDEPYRSHAWTDLWNSFCDEHAEGVRDPAEHGAVFLRQFLDNVFAQEADEEATRTKLLAQVRRARLVAPKVWRAYCETNRLVVEPESHESRSLEQFIHQVWLQVTLEKPEILDASQDGVDEVPWREAKKPRFA